MRSFVLRLMLAAAAPSVGLAAAQSPNQLGAAEQADGWRLLFDGTSLTGWRGLGYDSVPAAHWRVIDGAIVKIATAKVQRQADGQPAAGGGFIERGSLLPFEL